MARYVHRSLPRYFAVLGGPNPPDALAFHSDKLQVLWNCSDEPWSDPDQHVHVDSDELFIILKGSLIVEVEDETFTIQAGETCFFPAGVLHAVTGGNPPIEGFVIRAPATPDKSYRNAVAEAR